MPNVTIYRDLPGVNEPRQERSRRAFTAALDALEELLAERPLAEVGVQDIADRAGLSITSIYARVNSKAGLVLALHERVITEGLKSMDQAAARLRTDEATVGEVLATIIEAAVEFTSAHVHVFAAVAASADAATHRRAAAFVRSGSARIASLLLPLLHPDATTDADADADADIDFAWRSTVGVLQQRWGLGGEEPGRHSLDDAQLAARLVRSFLATIGVDADGRTSHPGPPRQETT